MAATGQDLMAADIGRTHTIPDLHIADLLARPVGHEYFGTTIEAVA